MKLNRWRIGICLNEHYMVDVESETEEEALALANKKVNESPNDYLTGVMQFETSCFINDKESRGFVQYIPEYISKDSDDMEDFT